jgi:hypothetical protein
MYRGHGTVKIMVNVYFYEKTWDSSVRESGLLLYNLLLHMFSSIKLYPPLISGVF